MHEPTSMHAKGF